MDFREDTLYNAIKSDDTDASKLLKTMSINHLQNQLPDRPDLWKKLTPDYPVGCKRTIISSDYFPTLGQDHVHLETGRIECMTAHGIQVSDNEGEFDCIVFATGFQTTRFFQDSINITGVGSRSLKDIWQKGARALYGITVESLPNFAMLYGTLRRTLAILLV
jgi:cation diffusion facilitator CzcD-associated flavoprotein CzcO